LEHKNIVRYYHSWIEEPPKRWFVDKAKETFTKGEGISPMGDKDMKSLFTPSIRIMMSLENINQENHANEQQEELDCYSDSQITFGRNGHYTEERAQEEQQMIENQDKENLFQKQTFQILFIQVEICTNRSLDVWLMMSQAELEKRPNNPLKKRDKHTMLTIFCELASALEYVHSQGLTHRDLKPANVFFSKENRVKLGDFGLVTFKIGPNSNYISKKMSKFSQTAEEESNTIDIGTLLYMSPEIMTRPSYSQKVDVFSLGLILYEILEHFTTMAERYDKITKARNGIFDKEFIANHKDESTLIKKMLIHNPKKRLTSSKACSQAEKCKENAQPT